MSASQRILLVPLLALLVATAVGFVITGDWGAPSAQPHSGGKPSRSEPSPVDLKPLRTARELAALATAPEERAFAQEALRIADHEVDLAFAVALREAAEHPAPVNPQAREIQKRIETSQTRVLADQTRVQQLSKQAASAQGEKQDPIEQELELARAQLELDQDELADAKEDLQRAGGDPQARIQRMVEEHEAAQHGTNAGGAATSPTAPIFSAGILGRFEEWSRLRAKGQRLRRAQFDSEAAVEEITTKHEELEQHVASERSRSPELSGREAPPEAEGGSASPAKSAGRRKTAALLSSTRHLSADQKEMAELDKRIQDEKELSDIYGRWGAFAAAGERRALHQLLRGILAILLIALAAVAIDVWLERMFAKLAPDKKRLLTLRTVVRVSLQFFGAVVILLLIFGPPGQIATVLGLAGAGLTVALKDFIVGFFGWFVLMGKNGVRIGDWVEINGVSGEVVEIGLFHTVLLETGNWADAGHPTGRRVTFVNSFAIEGHYFNFSTSGQWLWDELQFVLPPGRDPYPVVEAIQKVVAKETEANARLAEQEWQRVARSKGLSAFSASPAFSVRPVHNGIEVVIRYITRANERHQVRSRLYHEVVSLLGRKLASPSMSPESAPQPAGDPG